MTCGTRAFWVQQLMSKYKSVSDGAWQACGAALALVHGGSLLDNRTLNDLCALFRFGLLLSLLHWLTMCLSPPVIIIWLSTASALSTFFTFSWFGTSQSPRVSIAGCDVQTCLRCSRTTHCAYQPSSHAFAWDDCLRWLESLMR